MSLLLDALKRAQQEREAAQREVLTSHRTTGTIKPTRTNEPTPELSLEPVVPKPTEPVLANSPTQTDAQQKARAVLAQSATAANAASAQNRTKERASENASTVVAAKTAKSNTGVARNRPVAINSPQELSRKPWVLPATIGAVGLMLAIGYLGYQFWLLSSPKQQPLIAATSVPYVKTSADNSNSSNPPVPKTEHANPATLAQRLPQWSPDKTQAREYAERRAHSTPVPISPESNAIAEPPADYPVRVLYDSSRGPKPRLRLSQNIAIDAQSPQDQAQLAAGAAYQALAAGDTTAALAGYRIAVAKEPENITYLLGLAYVNSRVGEVAAANALYRRALQLDPNSAEAAQAINALQNARSNLAQPGAQTAAQTEVTDTNIKKPQRSELQIKADIALASGPAVARLWDELGSQFAAQNRWAEAQQAYFEAARVDSTNPRTLYNLATALDHLQQRQAALEYYARALRAGDTSGYPFSRDDVKARIMTLQKAIVAP